MIAGGHRVVHHCSSRVLRGQGAPELTKVAHILNIRGFSLCIYGNHLCKCTTKPLPGTSTANSAMNRLLRLPRIRVRTPVKKVLSIAIRYSHLHDQGFELEHAHEDSKHIIDLAIGGCLIIHISYRSDTEAEYR